MEVYLRAERCKCILRFRVASVGFRDKVYGLGIRLSTTTVG